MLTTTRAEQRRADWYDTHARRYDRRHPGIPGDREFYAALASGRRVLDLGCGTGRIAAALTHGAALVCGADRSRPMLERARATHLNGVACALVHCDAAALPFAATFDLVILAYRTVQHLSPERRLRLWSAVGTVLRADAAVLFDTWHGPPSGRRSTEIALEPVSPRQLAGELGEAGFTTVRTAPLPPGAGSGSFSLVWAAARGRTTKLLEEFHNFLDTYQAPL